MNIKVAAFTVSEKSINTILHHQPLQFNLVLVLKCLMAPIKSVPVKTIVKMIQHKGVLIVFSKMSIS